MSVKYSPLCDTDLGAYLAYCAGIVAKGSKAQEAVLLEKFQQLASVGRDGSCSVPSRSCGRGGCASGYGCCRVGCVVVGGLVGSQSPRLLRDFVGDSVVAGHGGAGSSIVSGEVADSVECVSGGNVVGSGAGGGSGVAADSGAGSAGVVSGQSSVGLPGLSEAVAHGSNLLRNRENRKKKQEKKKKRQLMGEDWRKTRGSVASVERLEKVGGQVAYRGVFSTCAVDVQRQLVDTRAARLIEENKLALALSAQRLRQQDVEEEVRVEQARLRLLRAKQQCALVEAQDISKLKKMHETRVMRQTETNKVAVEKAFASLASSGDVPSLVGGHAVTIRSGSISPNSSASEAEVRKVQKDLADMTERMERLQACLAQGDVERAKKVAAGEKVALGEYEDSVGLTVPEGGPPSIWYADGGYIAGDGRFHSMPGEYDNFQFEE